MSKGDGPARSPIPVSISHPARVTVRFWPKADLSVRNILTTSNMSAIDPKRTLGNFRKTLNLSHKMAINDAI